MFCGSAPAPVDVDSVPLPLPVTPQVVPRTLPRTLVMSPYPVPLPSVSADSDKVSSAPLELCTSTLYLTVAQPASVPARPGVTVAVLGASEDVTVTLLDCALVNFWVVLMPECPATVKISVTTASSPWTAVKSHVAVEAAAISSPAAAQVVLAMEPRVPAGQAGVTAPSS